jgi:hypothetical protein
LTTQLTTLETFLLMKINDEGELEWNLDEVKLLADAYDRGERTEDAHRAKLISLVWREGYCAAMDDVEETQQKVLLLMSCVGGNA